MPVGIKVKRAGSGVRQTQVRFSLGQVPAASLGLLHHLFEPQFLWLENGMIVVLHRVVVGTVCCGACKSLVGPAYSPTFSKPSPRSLELPADKLPLVFQGHAAFFCCGVRVHIS